MSVNNRTWVYSRHQIRTIEDGKKTRWCHPVSLNHFLCASLVNMPISPTRSLFFVFHTTHFKLLCVKIPGVSKILKSVTQMVQTTMPHFFSRRWLWYLKLLIFICLTSSRIWSFFDWTCVQVSVYMVYIYFRHSVSAADHIVQAPRCNLLHNQIQSEKSKENAEIWLAKKNRQR